MTDDDTPGAPIDVSTLEVLARRADTHPLVDDWALQPDAMSPRRLDLSLDVGQYPMQVDAARLDVRWFEGGDYTVHYLETRGDDVWQCRWDRHPKPGAPAAHYHPPPDASSDAGASNVDAAHHLDVLFAVLDWITDRIATLHEG